MWTRAMGCNICHHKRSRSEQSNFQYHRCGALGDRELCTIVECLAGGNSIPFFVIAKGTVIIKRWFAEIPPELGDMAISVSESDYIFK